MRLTLSILILTILGVCYTQTPDYATMSPTQFRNNAIASQLRDSGIQLVLAQAVDANVIAAPNYVLRTTDNVGSRSQGLYDFFRYTCSLANPNNDILTTTFVMRYNTETEASDLFTRSWRIEFADHASSAPAYISLDPSQYTDPFIQELSYFGMDFVENRAINLGWITPGDYYIVVTNYVQRQDLKDGSNYQIGINFRKDGDEMDVQAGFRIKVVNSTGAKSVEAYNYTRVPSEEQTTVVPPVEEEVVVPPPVEEEVVIPPPVEEEVIIPPVEEEVVIPPVEEEVVVPPPVEEEVVVPPPVEEEVIVEPPSEETDSTLTPSTGNNQFGFSSRPGL